MGSNIKSLVTLLIFAVLVGGAYLASQRLEVFDTSKQLGTYETSASNLEREILVRLSQINAITLSGELFTRPEYKSLKDVRVELPKPVVSRSDPFNNI